jgi:hypothetical protein
VKRIIVLDNDGSGRFRVLYWAAVPAGREARWLAAKGNPTESAWDGASAAENTAIAAGEVVEFAESYSKQGADLPSAQADLEVRWQQIQDDVTNNNPWNRYGSFWDDTPAWTLTGVS